MKSTVFTAMAAGVAVAASGITPLLNSPRDGDSLTAEECPGFFEGASGDGAFWTVPDQQEGAGHPISYRVSGDTAECIRGGFAYEYRISGDTLSLIGLQNPFTDARFAGPFSVLPLAMELGDSVSLPIAGETLYSGRTRIAISGTATAVADARGALCCGGDTLRGVLRIRQLAEITSEVLDSLAEEPLAERSSEERHLYYAPGWRYPVVEAVRTSTGEGLPAGVTYLALPEAQEWDLGADPENELLRNSGGAAWKSPPRGSPCRSRLRARSGEPTAP